MSDVTAVLLTIGESYLERARASVEDQTLQPADIVVVRDTSPFHRAITEGAARVRTPFFLQVDADMVLDSVCIERLRIAMTDEVAHVVGHLRDALCGRVVGVKLFRTACFREIGFGDSISPDTDYVRDLHRSGQSVVYPLRFEGPDPRLWHSFGDHRPDYSPQYTFAKYLLEGRRYLHREYTDGWRWKLSSLRRSSHPSALWAQVGLARGVFLDETRDRLVPLQKEPDFEFLSSFLGDSGPAAFTSGFTWRLASWSPETIFRRLYRTGARMADSGDPGAFRRQLLTVAGSRHPFSWLATLGLCQGLFERDCEPRRVAADYNKLEPLLAGYRPGRLLPYLRQRLRHIRQRLRGLPR